MLPEIISRARARLLVRAPFFGAIALGLRRVSEPDIGTMATDGRTIWFHAGWCETHGIERTMGVVAYEVLHVVNKHHLRRRERDLWLWNVACDLFINRILLADDYVLPDTLIFDRDGRFDGLPAEVIYERLLEEAQRNQEPKRNEDRSQDTPGQGLAQSQGEGNQDRESAGQGIKPAESWGEMRDLLPKNGGKRTERARRQAEDELDLRIRQAAAAA